MALPAAYRAVLVEHRQRLARLVDRGGVPQVKALYEEAHGQLIGKLARTLRGESFTAHQLRQALGQVRQAESLLSSRMAGKLGDITAQAQGQALSGLVGDIHRLHREFTGSEVVLPIEEAARFRGVVDARRTSVLRANATSMARYGTDRVARIEQQLSLSMLTGESSSEAIDRVVGVVDAEWWKGERIVRTETAWAYNATHSDGVAAAAEGVPGLMQRWSEYVSDAGTPLDDRVAVDSLAMHGQVAPPGGQFTMPPAAPGGEPVPRQLAGKSWAFPPNRPNDRAVLAPWRRGWGIPGWRWAHGSRVPL